jgi:hypothetical protein
MQREELRDGYINVLRELYSPEQYFKRLDSLYLDRGLGESKLRQRSATQKPLQHAANAAFALLQTIFIFIRLQMAVKERELRQHYRRFTYNALRRRPNPFVLQTYALGSGHALPLPPSARRDAGEWRGTPGQHILRCRATRLNSSSEEASVGRRACRNDMRGSRWHVRVAVSMPLVRGRMAECSKG